MGTIAHKWYEATASGRYRNKRQHTHTHMHTRVNKRVYTYILFDVDINAANEFLVYSHSLYMFNPIKSILSMLQIDFRAECAKMTNNKRHNNDGLYIAKPHNI